MSPAPSLYGANAAEAVYGSPTSNPHYRFLHGEPFLESERSRFDDPFCAYPYLTVQRLRDELEDFKGCEEVLHLIKLICDCSDEVWDQPTDVHEWRSYLRYQVEVPATGQLKLACEWVRLLTICTDYLEQVPPNVRSQFHAQKSKLTVEDVPVCASLASWIYNRTEDSKKMWNVSALQRNISCGWDLETGITQENTYTPICPNKDHIRLDKSPQGILNGKPSHMPTLAGISHDSARQGAVNPTRQSRATPTAVGTGTPTIPQHLIGLRLGLRPPGGKSSWEYEWSFGRKRAWIDLHGTLPADALKDYDNVHTSNCTYEHADIRLLGGIYVTIIELMSFFPEHHKWRAIANCMRIARWSAGKIREYIFWSRQLPVTALRAHLGSAMRHQSVQSQTWTEVQIDGVRVNSAAGWTMGGISTDRSMGERAQYSQLSDYFLVDLAEGLVNFPHGADRGILTVTVQHAMNHGHDRVKMSNLASYVQTQALVQQSGVSLARTSIVFDADSAALQYHNPSSRRNSSRVQAWWSAGVYSHD
ncbi:hypothetical protein HBH70_172360 [Parastagonospora nodorum]|nr:hypothetical protein HBH51_189790 [Parastagonospora nodorum]KAH4921249.1 hypothetical protein HBI79_186990 [Parastagonospora nodorum]KAH4978269.1 hypothetical protein HBI76_212230 [Parastagonospora nodorum]KAH5131781.1 hypothetical protein HBH70_172360 [Parastagonospora nodorum]KAH5290184.1 hypothetical protein HBI11_215720 [Parastagonospora nodorum]